ncbi:MAG: helix-turn-helix transcriptional regulator [Novosphingobium sp.]
MELNRSEPWSGSLQNADGAALQIVQSVESAIEFVGGRIEVVHYRWAQPCEASWTSGSDRYLVELALSGGPRVATSWHVGVRGRRDRRTVGRIMVVPPSSRLNTAFTVGTQRSLNCFLDRSFFQSMLVGRPRWKSASLDHALSFSSAGIEWLLRILYDEVRNGGPVAEPRVRSITHALVAEIISRLGLANDEPQTCGGLPQWRLRLLRDLIYREGPKPSLGELAAGCNLSVRQLRRAFKQETGQGIRDYMGEVTMDQAHLLLADSGHPIREIADHLGFATPASFSYAFRKATGLRPGDVRRGGLLRPARCVLAGSRLSIDFRPQ